MCLIDPPQERSEKWTPQSWLDYMLGIYQEEFGSENVVLFIPKNSDVVIVDPEKHGVLFSKRNSKRPEITLRVRNYSANCSFPLPTT